MESIVKLGERGRVYIPKAVRDVLKLEEGGYVSVDVAEVRIERLNDALEDSNEK